MLALEAVRAFKANFYRDREFSASHSNFLADELFYAAVSFRSFTAFSWKFSKNRETPAKHSDYHKGMDK